MFECKAFFDERDASLATVYSTLCPDARLLPDEYRLRLRLLMGDALPQDSEMIATGSASENSLYRYLITISTLRLGILIEQGGGS